MRYIDMATWPRRKHFAVYNGLDYPHFGLCADVDVSGFYAAVKARGASFTIATVYAIGRAANLLAPFRYRIRGDAVVEHAVVHPSSTILTDGDLFSFCTMPYADSFAAFAPRAAAAIAGVQAEPVLEDEPGQDDLLFMSGIPWVSFTSMVHPIHLSPVDSVPRMSWGKFRQDGARRTMPLAVQAHHALMDGFHVGQYYTLIQDLFDAPDELLG